MSNFVVGVTGGVGSGKSAVAGLFARKDIVAVDTDDIAHALTRSGGQAMAPIRERFGPAFVSPDGALDRAVMRQRVFSDAGARAALEGILHPLIRAESDRACRAASSPYVLLLVPLMAETWARGGYRERCQKILVIDCPEEVQVARVMARNGFSADAVRAIMAAQATRQQRLDLADDVLENTGSLEELTEQVNRLHEKYLELAKELKVTC